MRLSGVAGHRVFMQDSDRPGINIVSIYTVHRRGLGKPEKDFLRSFKIILSSHISLIGGGSLSI
jgi:hypothetical protein